MPRFDAIIITTVKADSIEEGEDIIRTFADGLADTEHAPFTGLVDPREYDNDGQRVIYLHPLDVESSCGGAEDGWHLSLDNDSSIS